ncbi:hypothetical protein TNCV_1240071 [Trichonephila clavipes]|uniref:Uncharacterized protein n=1 Tax=Trichonephila clavipes TaxID=2585209 RepID=A0A8X6WFC6_TRICX|nr:hypothetical protein TNCV_1240071 [Trichonephila clavipes]
MLQSRFASKIIHTAIRFSIKPKPMSHILCVPDAIPKDKSASSSCISLKLMLSRGLIKHVYPGVFILMPIAVRSLEKLCNIVDAIMNTVSGQKVSFPTLTPESLMQISANAQSFFQKHRDTPAIYVTWNSAPSQKYQVYLEHILLPQRSFLPSLPSLQQVFHRQGLLKIPIRKNPRETDLVIVLAMRSVHRDQSSRQEK